MRNRPSPTRGGVDESCIPGWGTARRSTSGPAGSATAVGRSRSPASRGASPLRRADHCDNPLAAQHRNGFSASRSIGIRPRAVAYDPLGVEGPLYLCSLPLATNVPTMSSGKQWASVLRDGPVWRPRIRPSSTSEAT